MYSGLTFTRYSGRLMGAHQKIDRVARRFVGELEQPGGYFPSIQSILNFEGTNGPDGIKRKSPAQNEPWHYINPLNEKDRQLSVIIQTHFDDLVSGLRDKNYERSAFEAAWLAHALVDGLTPAHHFPYEEKLVELRAGLAKETRTTPKEKLIMKGNSMPEVLANNLKYWGPKGLWTSHMGFEFGFGFIIRPLRFSNARPSESDILEITQKGIVDYFVGRAKEIAVLEMFESAI